MPYAAWKTVVEVGANAFYKALLLMMNGCAPPDGFNDSLGIFLPKGSSDEDAASGVKRSAENTRPLGLKNIDNKTIAAAINHANCVRDGQMG